MTTTPARLLATHLPPALVRASLLPRDAWRPYPPADDRAAWDGLPARDRAALIAAAEVRLGMSWPELQAVRFLDYVRNGDRGRYEAAHFARRYALIDLALGECAEGQGRFTDDIINGVWALCEESFWGVPAHSGTPRFSPPLVPESHHPTAGLPDTAYPYIDLFAAETGALLAWVHYLLGARLGALLPVVTDRIEREIQFRILEPFRAIDDWWWLGKRPDYHVNNWNPWILSNILATTLLMDTDPAVRAATVSRAIESLDAFLGVYHDDGGCDEGTSYWGRAGGSLFDCLDLLDSASGGALDAFSLPLIGEIGRYIYRMHIGGDWFVNFADGAARVGLDATIVYHYGRRIGDAQMAAQGAAARRDAESSMRITSIGRRMRELFRPIPAAAPATPPLILDAWLNGIEVLTARERAGTTAGLFLAAKGGHNGESHNHNDIGTFIVALDGQPVLIDAGVGVYTRLTFSADRYAIWTMQSAYHNLPQIGDYQQSPGRDFQARDVAAACSDERAELTLDIAPAYPPEAGVCAWRRTIRLERAPEPRIVLEDTLDLTTTPPSLTLHLLARDAVDTDTPGLLRCAGPTRPLLVSYDPQTFAVSVEPIPIADARLASVWGDRIYRVALALREPQAQGSWTLTMEAG